MHIPIATMLLVLVISPRPGWGQARPLTLTYLANMGVHLERDGLHHGALAEYPAVPPQLLGALEQARPPFAVIDLALTTPGCGLTSSA